MQSSHLRTHMGQCPYKCPTREDGFNDTSILIKHQRTLMSARTSAPSSPSAPFSLSADLLEHQWAHVGASVGQGTRPAPASAMCGVGGVTGVRPPGTGHLGNVILSVTGAGKGDTHERGRLSSHVASQHTRGG